MKPVVEGAALEVSAEGLVALQSLLNVDWPIGLSVDPFEGIDELGMSACWTAAFGELERAGVVSIEADGTYLLSQALVEMLLLAASPEAVLRLTTTAADLSPAPDFVYLGQVNSVLHRVGQDGRQRLDLMPNSDVRVAVRSLFTPWLATKHEEDVFLEVPVAELAGARGLPPGLDRFAPPDRNASEIRAEWTSLVAAMDGPEALRIDFMAPAVGGEINYMLTLVRDRPDNCWMLTGLCGQQSPSLVATHADPHHFGRAWAAMFDGTPFGVG